MTEAQTTIVPATLRTLTDQAVRAVPPVWPLASSVAVNPFLGQSHLSLSETAALMRRVSGIRIAPPRETFAQKIAAGVITDEDLAGALAAGPTTKRPPDVRGLKAAAIRPAPKPERLPTAMDLAATATGTDWPGIFADRLGVFASGYFDEGQALWAAPSDGSAYTAWREAAVHDLTPEIAGLSGFAHAVSVSPLSAEDAIDACLAELGLTEAALPTYLHALMASLGGWGQVARYKLWQAELAGRSDTTGVDLLAVRLVFEAALYRHCRAAIDAEWTALIAAHEAPVEPSADDVIDEILQDAAERASQRTLAGTLAAATQPLKGKERPKLQAAFCIDVRSEVFRRALESLDPGIETLGFAGFFGVATSHKRFASDVAEHRLPVLLNAGVHSHAGMEADTERETSTRFVARAKRAWGRFKLAAVSSFAFVEAMGPVYAQRLVRDSLGRASSSTTALDDPAPTLSPALDLETRVGAAETVLRAMSLTDNFAPLILLAGHGANVVNNPHASALHCGACGGYSGEVNARLLAALLNDGEVRSGLRNKGIDVPDDTLFLAGLHDTTTDAVRLYEGDAEISAHADPLNALQSWLSAAARLSAAERALRLPRADGADDISRRSRDWAETRPEWALAGCKAFIAAPRARTAAASLEGRAFLHDYDHRADAGFSVLELILTAPVVVASWISLQYYGSTVAHQAFGAGNKLLHNVVGGLGVVEGNGGILRVGLPFQSVHDGENFAHEPLRLAVVIEAPREAMIDILARHDGVRALFDNGWLDLFALDEAGRMAWRYAGDLTFEPTTYDTAEARALAVA